ncbi:Hsp70 family protein [Phaeosphaeriaceae sp. PMI808]|nr:Hsp70 family protein [Phaeosphaeriaceae sp. PMI808]
MRGNRLVVGLDYGTTYTGVSYCETSDTGTFEKHIDVVNDWPSRHSKIGTREKVPSEIAYQSDGEKWGSLIPPNVSRHMWTKLQLDRPQTGEAARIIGEQQHVALALDKEPVDIAADFLTHVKDHLLKSLDIVYGRQIWATLPITLLVTIPAIWSDAAKNLTLQAVQRAGFNNTHFPQLKRTVLVTEPEAASIYTIKTLHGTTYEQQLKLGNGFIICDMGGGTADRISYRIAKLQPTVIEEATVGTGDQCGGSFVDRAFFQWLETRLGETDFVRIAGCRNKDLLRTSITPKLSKMLLDFISEIKHGFSGDETNFLRLPSFLGNLEDPTRGIVDGEIEVTPNDMVRMFEYTLRRIYELIQDQIVQARHAGVAIKHLFLVGGFSESPYLYTKLKIFGEAHGLMVVRPAYAWSAVVRGATAKGLEGDGRPAIRSRKCRRHYGTHCNESFVEGRHRESESFICPFTGKKKAQDQISWHLKKGQDLPTSEFPHAKLALHRIFMPGLMPSDMTVTLWASDIDLAPNRMKNKVSHITFINVYKVATLHINLTGLPASKCVCYHSNTNSPYQRINFDVELSVTSLLEYSVSIDGTRYGSVTASYA